LEQKSVGGAGQRKVDWTAADALTDDDIAASIRDDPDVAPELDDDWFAPGNAGYPLIEGADQHPARSRCAATVPAISALSDRINAILRVAMEHEKKKAG
jgi:hypothetical protein